MNIASESLVRGNAAISTFPKGARPSPQTIHRWMLRGTRGVTLESVVVGGKRFTSVEAIGRFVARLNAPRPPKGEAIKPDAATRLAQAKAALDALGV